MKIAVIGSSMVDIMSYIDKVPAVGETREVSDFAISCGGKGANQAIAAAKVLETMKKSKRISCAKRNKTWYANIYPIENELKEFLAKYK
jgi:hypothetical protein